MAIENRDLPAGTRLVATYKKQAFACTVEEGEDGKLAFVVDGKRYSSPSSAGSAVMGGSACNGWRFWSVEGMAPATATKPVRAPTKANSGQKSAKPGPQAEDVGQGAPPDHSTIGAPGGCARRTGALLVRRLHGVVPGLCRRRAAAVPCRPPRRRPGVEHGPDGGGGADRITRRVQGRSPHVGLFLVNGARCRNGGVLIASA